MAVEETGPHGLKKYTAGNDNIPGRLGYNEMIGILNTIPGLGVGPLSARPAPSAGLRFWVEESTNRLFVNTGVSWSGIAEIGGVTPGTISVTGTASEGSSSRAARADHTHRLALATTSAHGGMSSSDKVKLDGATSSAVAGQIVARNGAGDTTLNQVLLSATTPTTGAHATRKDYVDNKTWPASSIVSGVLDPARVQVASQVANGLLSALDKKKLDEASTSGTNNIMMRNSGGTSRLNTLFLDTDPVNSNEAAHKGYVDSSLTSLGNSKSNTGHKHDGADITTGTIDQARIANATSSLNGLMSSADKAKIDAAATNATANTVALRDASGRISVGSPTVAAHAATKTYVDTAASNASNLTSGTVNPARIANASSSLNGLMSSTDKAKLDGSTAGATGNTLVRRNAVGDAGLNRLELSSEPIWNSHAVNKSYVDELTAKGHVTVNATANVPTTVNISFPAGQFETTPAILLTPYGAQGSYAGPLTLTNVSLTGATINLTRTTTGEAIVAWAAIA